MSLEDRLEGDRPPAWRPDQDDPAVLVGEVINIDIGSSDYGEYPIIVVRTSDGDKSVHAFKTVLRNELMRQRPQIGQRLGIKYLGEQASKPGSKYKSYTNYRVEVERNKGATFDWTTLGEGSEDDQSGHIIYDRIESPEPQKVTVPDDAGDDDVPFLEMDKVETILAGKRIAKWPPQWHRDLAKLTPSEVEVIALLAALADARPVDDES